MSDFFDPFDAPKGNESAQFFDPFDAPAAPAPAAKKQNKGILSDIGGAFVGGAKSAGQAVAATGNVYTGNEQALIDKAKSEKLAQEDKPEALRRFNEAVQANAKPLGEDPGLWDSIKAVGGAVLEQPKGAGLAIVEQLPNSAPAMAGGLAGMKAGAMAGTAVAPGVGTTIGGILGGVAGMFLGNTAIETGHKAIEAAHDGSVTPDEMAKVRKEGAAKAGVITGVDALTLGLSKGITNAGARAVESATRKTLADAGVNVADKAALLAARQSPEISSAVRAAQETALASANTLGKRAAAGGAALGLETVGEGVGEYFGELAATGKANMVDAVLESVLSLGQSGAEVAWGAARNKKGEGAGLWDIAGGKYAETKSAEIAGLLPAPTYTGTPGEQIIANDAERQAAIDAADKNAAELYAARDEFERKLRQAVTITNEPAPLQERIDEMLRVDTSKLSGIARTNYEKALEAAFNEPIGIRHDKDQREVPFTIGEYLDAQVALEDAVRNREKSGRAVAESGTRLQQLAEEDATQQPDIPAPIRGIMPAIPVVGPLSKAANAAVQAGITPVQPVSAGILAPAPAAQPAASPLTAAATLAVTPAAATPSAAVPSVQTATAPLAEASNAVLALTNTPARTEAPAQTPENPLAAAIEPPQTAGAVNLNLSEVRQKNGAIGTQGVSETGIRDVLTHVAGMQIPEGATLREMIEALKASPSAQSKLRNFTRQNPMQGYQLPDGTIQVQDGHHRAFLLDQIGDTTVPAVIRDYTGPSTAASEVTAADTATAESEAEARAEAAATNAINKLNADMEKVNEARDVIANEPLYRSLIEALIKNKRNAKQLGFDIDGAIQKAKDAMHGKKQMPGAFRNLANKAEKLGDKETASILRQIADMNDARKAPKKVEADQQPANKEAPATADPATEKAEAMSVEDRLRAFEKDAGGGFKTNDTAITIIKKAIEGFASEAKAEVTRFLKDNTSKQANGDVLLKPNFYDELAEVFIWTRDYLKNALDDYDATTYQSGARESSERADKTQAKNEADSAFDSESWDKAREERIKASKKSGAKHLDDVPAAVESMRGKEIFYVHDTKQRGVIRTVDNRGNVYVHWSDKYSADKELASEVVEDNKLWLRSSKKLPILRVERGGKTYVFQSSLGTSDLKDYVFADAKENIDTAANEAATSPTNDTPQPTTKDSRAWEKDEDIDGLEFHRVSGPVFEWRYNGGKDFAGTEVMATYPQFYKREVAEGLPASVVRHIVAKTRMRMAWYEKEFGIIGSDKTALAPSPEKETSGLGELEQKLREIEDEIAAQGAVQNARTREKRDMLRKAILEIKSPEILKALDGVPDFAEAVARALEFNTGSDDKAATVRRALQNKGVVDPYLTDMTNRVMAAIGEGATEPQVESSPVVSLFTGNPDPKNSPKMQELDGFKAGDRVSVKNRTIGDSTVQFLFKRNTSGMEMMTARVVNDSGKELDVLTSELEKKDRGEDLGAMFDDLMGEIGAGAEVKKAANRNKLAEAKKARAPKAAPTAAEKARKERAEAGRPQRTAGEAAKSAAKNTAEGFQNAIAGLGKLFGGNGRLSAGLTFDEDTYKQAKPLFSMAVANFKQAGADLKDVMKAVMLAVQEQFGDAVLGNMKPYIVRFVADVRDGKVSYDESVDTEGAANGKTTGEEGNPALEGVAPEPTRGTAGSESTTDGGRSSGEGGGAGNQGTDGRRGETGRSGGSGASEVDSAAAGRNGRGSGSRADTDRTGKGTGGTESGLGSDQSESERQSISEGVTPATIPEGNFEITADVGLGSGGQMTKYRDNVAAIKVLKTIEAERRRATAAEKKVLARYVGWGGIPNAFRNGVTGQVAKDWGAEVAELESLLTPKELRAASASTRNAHYTAKEVVDFMWRTVGKMGFAGGMALEPSVGTGNFIGLMPKELAGETFVTGIELDSLTARIAGALYPKSSIINTGFQKAALPSGRFKLAIGNPPFGAESLRFQYKPELNGASIHNQFFLGSMDALEPGGIMAMVVSRYLMDAKDAATREKLAIDAKMVGAFRLPGSAFKGNALTEVVTDVLFFRKRSPEAAARLREAYHRRGKPPKMPARPQDSDRRALWDYQAEQSDLEGELRWTSTAEVADPLGGEPMVVSQWFADHPEFIVGKMDRSGSMRQGGDIDVKLEKGEKLADRLNAFVEKMEQQPAQTQNDEARANAEKLHRAMGESLRLSAKGAEADAIYFDDDGDLTTVVERVGSGNDTALTTIKISPETPWSPKLAMDLDGHWFQEVAEKDKDGNNVKVVKDGKATKYNVYVREVYKKEADVPSSLRLGKKGFEKLKALIGLRDLLVKQIDLEVSRAAPEQMEGNRAELRQAYDAFVSKFGFISENASDISDMPDEGLLMSLETSYRPKITEAKAASTGMSPAPASAKPAAILSRPVAIPPAAINHADTPSDALAVVLSESGRIDIERVAELRGIDKEAATAELTGGETPLAFKDPENGDALVEKNAYLSGNVRRKLEAARQAGMDSNIKALEAVQPEPWGSDKVTARIGANWIPATIYSEFVSNLLGEQATVQYAKLTNTFEVSGNADSAAATATWGTKRVPAPALIGNILNSSRIAVYDSDGEGGSVFNQTETDAANDKAKEIREEFDNWIFKDADRRAALTKLFNDTFNTRVTPQYDGSHLKFPGKVPDAIIALRRGQINAVWRGIIDNFVLYDHAVGAGKTFTGIARAIERRRMGLSKKPMIVVPNHMVGEWAAQAYRLYPGARILAATKKDLQAKNRRRLFAKIASGDWDMVIVPHSSFQFLAIAPETEERILLEELAVAQAALAEAQEDADPGARFKSLSVKEAEALIEKIEKRLETARGKQGKDRLLTFEQMGVDDLTIDESHEFKNLFYSSRLTDVRGMGNKQGSNKAFDLFSKARVIRDAGGSLAFLTGTPISNSAVELYNILRYLAPETLQESGLEHFDAFRSQYVDATAKFEPTDSGGSLKLVTRLGRSWSNMRSLMELYYSVADVVTNDDIKRWFAEDNPGKEFPLPKVKGGDRQAVSVKPTPTQLRLLEETISDFNGLEFIDDVKERNAERLRLMDRARKLSLHAKAVNPLLDDEPGGKLDVVADKAAAIYRKWMGDKGTQLIFMDRGVPKAKGDAKIIKEYDELTAKLREASLADDEEAAQKIIDKLEKFDENEIKELRSAQESNWSGYQHIKDRLVALGVPANEIAFVQDFDGDAAKEQLFQAVRDGTIRILLGSTPRMGAGTNVQERLVALHHVDATWKPSDIEQREGRIIRQGNALLEKYGKDFEVEILAYVTERTVDAKLWDLNATKLRMINAIRYYDGAFEMDFDDEAAVGMAEIAAIASGDPLLLERFKLSTEIDNLYRAKRSHRRRVESAEDTLRSAKRAVENAPMEMAEAKEDANLREAWSAAVAADAAGRTMVMGGKKYGYEDSAQARMDLEKFAGGIGEDEKFSLTINGKEYTSKGGAEEAIQLALGDIDPFVAEIDGKKLTRRSDYARALRERIGDSLDEKQTVAPFSAGTIGGIPVHAEVLTYWGGPTMFLGLAGKYESTGRKRSIAGSYGLTPEKHKSGEPIPVTVNRLRSLIAEFEKHVYYLRDGSAEIAKRAEKAAKDIPSLEEQIGVPFKGEEELAEKTERLRVVEAELNGRKAAEEQAEKEKRAQAKTAAGEQDAEGQEGVGSRANRKDAMSPSDKAIYGMAAEGKSAAEILNFIASASRNPFYRQLAKLLLKTGIAPKITVGDSKGWKMNAGEGHKYAAAYNPKTDTVALFRPSAAERNMLHELVHAATIKALEKGGLSAAQMRALYQHVKKTGKLHGMYGMTDVDEFVTEAFTNPKFQEALKKVMAPQAGGKLSSAWQWFVRVVRGILGLKANDESALSAALEIGLGVMREDMQIRRGESGVPFSEITGREIERTLGRTLQEKATNWMRLNLQGKSFENDATGWDIAVGRKGINKAMSHGARDVHARSVAAIPDLLKHAILVASEENRDAIERESVPRVHHFYAPLRINGAEYIARMVVKEAKDGTRFYDYDTSDEISPAVPGATLPFSQRRGAAPSARLEMSMANLLSHVKAEHGGTDPRFKIRHNVAEFFRGMGIEAGASGKMIESIRSDVQFVAGRDEKTGFPTWKGAHVSLSSPRDVTESHDVFYRPMGGERAVKYDIRSANGQIVGHTVLEIDGDWPTMLLDIEVQKQHRGNRYAEKAVAGIVADAGEIGIWHIVPSARSWWERIGTQTVDAHNGTLAFNDYADARSGREDAQSLGKDVGIRYNIANEAHNESYDLPEERIGNRSLYGAELETLRRAAARLEDAERGVTFRVTEDGQAVVTGPARFNIPDRFKRFAEKHGLTFKAERGSARLRPDGTPERTRIGAMPENYRVSGALYAQEVGSNYDRTDRTRFNVADDGWSVSEPSKMDDVIYALQDKHIDTKRVVQAIIGAGKKIRDAFNPYLQEELFHGRAAKGVKDFLDFELRPLLKDMQSAGVEMGDFEEYLWNRHAEERNRQVAKVNPDMKDGGSGIKTADARAYLAGLPSETKAKYEQLAKRIDAISRNSQGILVSSGLETQETIDAWNGAYQHYVPLQREDVDSGHVGTGKGFSVRGSATKRAMGSGRKVVDIIGNLTMQRERNIVRAEKNRVSNALLGLAVQNPNPEFWQVDQAPKERVVEEKAIYTVKDAEGNETEFTRMADAEKFARSLPDADIEQTWGDRVTERVIPGFSTRDNVILTRINGQDHYVVFNERNDRAMRMAQSLKNLDTDNLGRVLSVAGKATRYLASINTQYNPVFGVINLIRDAQGSLLNLSSTQLAGEQKRVLGYTVDALRGIYADIRAHRAGKAPSSNWAKLFEEFQREGGQTGYRDQYANAEDRAEAVRGELAQFKEGKAKQMVRGIFGWLSDYNEAMENAVRLAAYKAATEKGMSKQQAASLAKNITVNFNRKGQMATQVGALYAFFNASVQGTARIAETLFDKNEGNIKAAKLSKTGKKIIAGGVMLGSMQALLLAAAGFDDDEPPEFVRERNLVMPIGDGKYLTLAMPLGFHVLPGIGRIATEFVLSGGKDPAKKAASFVSMFAEAFNPVGNSGFSLQTITPSVVDPFAALAENKDFTGKEIYRKDFNSLNPQPGHARAKDVSTVWSRYISEALNYITGGSEFRPGLVSVSPDALDYLVGQATGGVGREVSKAFQSSRAVTTGEDLPLYKVPLVGRFVGDTEGQSGQSQKFYDAVRTLNGHENEIKGLLKQGRREEATAYRAENPESSLIMAGNHAETIIRKLRAQKRELIAKEADKEQVRAIDERISTTMKRFNERYRAVAM